MSEYTRTLLLVGLGGLLGNIIGPILYLWWDSHRPFTRRRRR